MAAPGDVDLDGHADIMVSAGWNSLKSTNTFSGYVHVYSGKDGRLLHYFSSQNTNKRDYYGLRTAGAGDTNGDRYPDLLVSTLEGKVFLYSGKDGKELAVFRDDSGTSIGFSWAVSGAGDLNGDGFADVILGEPCADAKKKNSRVHVYAGNLVALQATKTALSLSKAGSLTFKLQAGPRQGGRIYLLLGSLSGIHPGLPLGPVYLPLVYDPWFLITLAHPNGTVFSRSLGVLDGLGRAATTFTLVRGLPASLADLSFHQAFVVLDLSRGRVAFASNPAPTKILP